MLSLYRAAILAIVILSLLLSACATNPVTGRRELSLMSEAQEINLGSQNDGGIVSQYGIYDHEGLQEYVEAIGERMVPVSHRPQLDFHFRLLDDSIVNAFALPGGYVYITRGILAYLNDEAALAGVIGHEIGHVTARHGVQRYTQQMIVGAGLTLGMVLSPEVARYGNLAGASAQLLLLKYGRDDERQSDQLGVEYATKIGYDTRGMAFFFHSLDRLSGGPEGRLPAWVSTHPDPGERFQTVMGLTTQWQGRINKPPYKSDADGFLDRIDGIVFGDDPRKGFVDGSMFYHPEMAFEFPIPPRWKVQNSAARVVMASSDQNTGVIFTIEDAPNAEAATDSIVAQPGTILLSRDAYQAGGLSAVRSLTETPDGQRVLATFIDFDDFVFAFYGISPAGSYEDDRRLLAFPADGFRRLRDPARLNVQPAVLRVVRVQRDGAFLDVIKDYPLPEGTNMTPAGLALLNGIEVNSWVKAGQKLKVLRKAGSS